MENDENIKDTEKAKAETEKKQVKPAQPEEIISEYYTSRSNEILTLSNFVTIIKEKQFRSGL